MEPIKIIALQVDDLPVVSAHMQDAVVRVGDMNYSKNTHQFVLVANRFDWADKSEKKSGFRCRTGLAFSGVKSVRVQNIRQGVNEAVLSLLAIEFAQTHNDVDGIINLRFSGGGEIELAVECLEVQMEDLGPRWGTANIPTHDQA